MIASFFRDEDFQDWNQLVARSKNGCFLFDRSYMTYHSDRFVDCSVVLKDQGGLRGIFPANLRRETNSVWSHQGLTFGGLIVDPSVRISSFLELFEVLLTFLRQQGLKSVIYKPMPVALRPCQSEEDSYALFLNSARLIRRETNFIVFQNERLSFQERRKRAIKKAADAGLQVKETRDLKTFWTTVLEPALWSKHQVRPTHSLDEISCLSERFPDKISLWGAFRGEEMLAGTVIYNYGKAWHSQYIASSEAGRGLGALDLLFSVLLENSSVTRAFSFGIANEDEGKVLNAGLAEWKESFGARTISHDFWEIEL